jgi:hypothetical protein
LTELVPSIRAARANPRVALVTCADLPDLEPDDRLVLAPLAALGITAEPAVWSDPGLDWTGYDLAVLRSSWDYATRYEEFLAWTRQVARLANTAAVVAWNTDKRYLADLAAAGVPVVPTRWIEPGCAGPLPPAGEYVIKPTVSVGGKDTGRFDLADAGHRRLAERLLARFAATGRTAMIQPYLAAVDRLGETAVHYLGGRFSHAVRKGAMLTGPDSEVAGLYRPERISPRRPTPAELAVAQRALDAVPGGDALLYARVDLILGPDGTPVVIELELTEPSLYLAMGDGAAQRFAAAIAARIGVATPK